MTKKEAIKEIKTIIEGAVLKKYHSWGKGTNHPEDTYRLDFCKLEIAISDVVRKIDCDTKIVKKKMTKSEEEREGRGLLQERRFWQATR